MRIYKHWSLILIIAVCISISMILMSCGPNEGVNRYRATIASLSPRERLIYDKLEDAWGAHALQYLRQALYVKRVRVNSGKYEAIQALDTSIPFVDVAETVLYTQDVIFTPSNRQTSAQQANHFQLLIPDLLGQLQQIIKDRAQTVDSACQKIVIDNVDPGKLLSLEDLQELIKAVDASNCEAIKGKLRDLYRQKRFLEKTDRDQLMLEIIACQNVELNNRVK
jgi:hypothetical protein